MYIDFTSNFTDTYEEGLLGLERLQYEENILSLDSEDNASKVQEKMANELRQIEMQRKLDKLRAKFNASCSKNSVTENGNINGKINEKTVESNGLLIFFLFTKFCKIFSRELYKSNIHVFYIQIIFQLLK